MLSTLAAWFATKGVGLLLGALVGFANDQIDKRRNAAVQRELGAADATAATNKETIDAQTRASEAGVNAASGADLDDDLISGRRGF